MTDTPTHTFELFNRAISEYHTKEQWLMILLKNQWRVEGNPTINARSMLDLNEYMTVEINRYIHTPLINVYVGVGVPQRRPRWISRVIDDKLGYTHVVREVASVLEEAYIVAEELTRGRNHYITLSSKDVIDVTNQLSN